MYQSLPSLLSEPNLLPEEKPKTPVLLTDAESNHSPPASQIFEIGREGDTPVLKSLHLGCEDNLSISSENSPTSGENREQTPSNMDLPPMKQPISSPPSTPRTAYRYLARESPASKSQISPVDQKFGSAAHFFPATTTLRSEVSTSRGEEVETTPASTVHSSCCCLIS